MVAAFRSAHGASRRCLLLGLDRRLTLLVSTPLLLEYETVLTRPEHLTACCASADDTAMVLDDVVASSHWGRIDLRRSLTPVVIAATMLYGAIHAGFYLQAVEFDETIAVPEIAWKMAAQPPPEGRRP